MHGGYDQDYSNSNAGTGQQFIVKDVFTLSNTSTNKTATSTSQLDEEEHGRSSARALDYKGRYILDGTYRYDGSSRFGSGNRWAPFGRVSGVWRVSEESFWHVAEGERLPPPRVARQRRATRRASTRSTRRTAAARADARSVRPVTRSSSRRRRSRPRSGTDFTLFDRLGVELTHAQSTTKNQILNAPTPSSLGFCDAVAERRNAGEPHVGAGGDAAGHHEARFQLEHARARGIAPAPTSRELFVPDYYTDARHGPGHRQLVPDHGEGLDGRRRSR